MFHKYISKKSGQRFLVVVGVFWLLMNAAVGGMPALAAVQITGGTVSGNEAQTVVDARENVKEEGTATQTDLLSGGQENAGINKTVSGNEVSTADIILPSRFEVALNPFRLAVHMGDGSYSTAQVISRNYGIMNTGSVDQIVTLTITIEDLNGDRIVFVDSPEAVKTAGEDVYAVYLALVPAAGRDQIRVNRAENSPEHMETKAGEGGRLASALSNVEMFLEEKGAVSLREGENQVTFQISGGFMTAFTFCGEMNERANWEKLYNGIKISAVYDDKMSEGIKSSATEPE